MTEIELMAERIKELRAENASLKGESVKEWRKCDLHPGIDPDRHWGCADCMAEARRQLRNLEARYASLRNQFDGFREGVRIGMEYTRRELAYYRAKRAAINARPSAVRNPRGESAAEGEVPMG